MKRRITTEQVEQLSDEQKVALRGVWKPLPLDVVSGLSVCLVVEEIVEVEKVQHATFLGYGGRAPISMCLPLLDMGQMIELLEPNGRFVRFTINSESQISAVDQYNSFESRLAYAESDNLCDALWEAVVTTVLVKEDEVQEDEWA